jgi:hypothetical protein
MPDRRGLLRSLHHSYDPMDMGPTSAAPARHTDSGQSLAAFADEFLVRCPACDRCAGVRRTGGTAAAGEQLVTVRLLCTSCGRSNERTFDSREWATLCYVLVDAGSPRTFPPVDPVFGSQLWLIATYRGNCLWFLNKRHLEEVASYIAATHRQRHGSTNRSMISRLPHWMINARARKDVLAAIDRLRHL